MSEIVNQPPIPSILLESLRNAGYTLETAVADIIDNSITAEAVHVSIQYRNHDQEESPWIAVCDDGTGMSEEELFSNMRLGSRKIDAERINEKDLGRFGLGMKTASLSQSRRVTVISWKLGICSAFIWDIDFIKESWNLQKLDEREILDIPAVRDILSVLSFPLKEHGTIVLWEKLDRSNAWDAASFDAAMLEVLEHVALVFHRFMEKEEGYPDPIMVDGNNRRIMPKSPFAPNRHHILYGGEFRCQNCSVKYQPYLLPRESEYEKPSEYDEHGGKEGYQRNQGFYVYRNRRLIEKATYFHKRKRLFKTQLLRIKLDVPVELDSAWNIDVRKSQVTPPRDILGQLDCVVESALSEAMALWEGKPRRTVPYTGEYVEPMWQPGKRDGTYELNKDHGLYKLVYKSLDEDMRNVFREYVQTVGDTFPYEQYLHDWLHRNSAQARVHVAESRIDELINALVAFGVTEAEIRRILENNETGFKPEVIQEHLLFKFQPTMAK